jgi:hypothetical protein
MDRTNNNIQQNIPDELDESTPSHTHNPPQQHPPASQPSQSSQSSQSSQPPQPPQPSLHSNSPMGSTSTFSFVVGPDGRLVTSPNTAAPSPGLANLFQSIFNMMNLPIPLANPLEYQNIPPTTLPQLPTTPAPAPAPASAPASVPVPALAPEIPTPSENDVTTVQPPNGLALSISFGFSREREPSQAQAPSPPRSYPLSRLLAGSPIPTPPISSFQATQLQILPLNHLLLLLQTPHPSSPVFTVWACHRPVPTRPMSLVRITG